MRKLFYLLLALPLVFAACEEPNSGVDEPQNEAVLTLTSDAEMNFDAAGGEGVITYTAELREVTREADGDVPKVSVSCEAQWVELGNPDFEKVSFTVAANDGEARETKVVVNYTTKSVEVTVKQAAKVDEPDPKPEYTMEVEMAAAARIPSDELNFADNYFALAFSDDAENIELGIVLVGAEGVNVLQAGDYASNNDTLLADACEAFVWEPAAEYTFAEGAATVALEGETYTFDIELADEAGKLYHFTYSGVVVDMVPAKKPDAETFVPVEVDAYRAASWDTGNFELDFYINSEYYHAIDMYDKVNPNNNYLSAGHYSMEDGSISSWSNMIHDLTTGEGAYVVAAELDLTHNEDGTSTVKGFFESEYGVRLNIDWTGVVSGFNFNAEEPTPGEDMEFTATFFGGEYYNVGNHNYFICLSDVEADGNRVEGATYYYFDLYSDDANDDLSVPNGVYTFDPTDSYDSGTFSSYYSYGFKVDGSNNIWYLYAEGSKVTVSDNKIVAELILEDGSKHTVTYEGELALSEVGGGSGLEGDLVLNETGWDVIVEYYGQYYSNDTDNYLVSLYEDADTGTGKCFILDLMADYATCVDHSGTFTATEETPAPNTFYTGLLDGGYLAGSWYAEIEDGVVSGVMAPLMEGTITVTLNADGTETYTFDCKDDQGYKITGTVTGSEYATEYSTMSKGTASKTKTRTIKIGNKQARL